MLSRRHFLQTTAGSAALAQTPSKPNVIVIVTDDQGIGDMGCYGAADIRTPNLDGLASEGVRFTNWHANAPVCSPSRASVLTGKYPQHAGIPEILFSRPGFDVPGLRPGEVTLASALRKQGYRTAAVGKWHLGSQADSRPMAQGFEEYFGFYSGWIDYFSHRYYTLGGQPVFHDLWRNQEEVWHEPEYQTELLGREAREFVLRQRSPFFLYLAFGAPHYPMMAPAKYLERFPASMDRDRRLHAAMIAAVDDAVGGVLKALDEKSLRNTIVFFQSDNGATREVRADHRGRPYEGGSNRPFRGSKGSLFEGGMRVPGILRWPERVRGGQVVDDLCAAMDLLPTILDWTGTPPAPDADGVSLAARLRGGTPLAQRTVFWNYAGQTAANDGRWKLVLDPREGLGAPAASGPHLFDIVKDPAESTNVAAQQPEITARLQLAAAAWRTKMGI